MGLATVSRSRGSGVEISAIPLVVPTAPQHEQLAELGLAVDAEGMEIAL
ncbi:hypothetical protein ACWD6P_02950 [Streptomyces sp. NPDC002446]